MNKTESYKLYLKGKDEWNKWAEGMLAKRETFESDGSWRDKKNSWESDAAVDFSEHEFDKPADFEFFVFPDDAVFAKATFSSSASFDDAVFFGKAHFQRVIFSANAMFLGTRFFGNTSFDSVTFSTAAFSQAIFTDDVWFGEGTFSGNVWFNEATFKKQATFQLMKFNKYASFEKVCFTSKNHAANFVAIRSQGQFTLKGTNFSTIPNFEQSHFEEAPSLDNILINSEVHFNLRREKNNTDKAKEASSRWRHLRRLATQGHDFERERDFFAEEVKSRRNVIDFPTGLGQARYWAGVIYEQLSDFGRSLTWPAFWWSLGTLFYFWLCLLSYFINSDAGKVVGVNGCITGDSTPFWAGLRIAISNAIPLPVFGISGGQVQEKLCLFGVDSGLSLPNRMPVPLVPDLVTSVGFIHALWSAVMIFLFLLAVRNHFRIR